MNRSEELFGPHDTTTAAIESFQGPSLHTMKAPPHMRKSLNAARGGALRMRCRMLNEDEYDKQNNDRARGSGSGWRGALR